VHAVIQPQTAPAVAVIDDDEIMRELMADWLEVAGYRVVVKAGDCEQAIAQLQSLQPALVVTDMFMPGCCAEAAIAEIRKVVPEAAIVAVSGYFKSGHRMSAERAIAAGASCAFAKPVQRSAFLKAVAELLHLLQP
jgi:CheY-like chemotaxis protein